MHLTRATQYAILAMAQLKPDGEPVPCSELAKLGNMPPRFLLQVLRNLVNAGLLKSTRGVDGGYRLAKPSKDISLHDIVVAIDGPIGVGDLSVLSPLAKKSQSMLQAAIKSGEQERNLRAMKLSDVVVA